MEDLKRRWVAAGFGEMDFVRFDEPPEGSQVIVEALRTAPFGSPRRLVVVDGFDELTEESAPWLVRYLEQPAETACLVLCADRADFKRSSRVHVIACRSLKGRELEEWIAARAKAAGKDLDATAAGRLIDRLGENLQALDLAVESLALLAGSAPRITAADVQALISPSVRETAFDILEHAVAGRPAQALKVLRRAVAESQFTLDQFFGAVSWYYRTAWKERRFPRERVKRSFEDLLRSDVQLKQGHPDPEGLADQLLLKLSGQPGLLP